MTYVIENTRVTIRTTEQERVDIRDEECLRAGMNAGNLGNYFDHLDAHAVNVDPLHHHAAHFMRHFRQVHERLERRGLEVALGIVGDVDGLISHSLQVRVDLE